MTNPKDSWQERFDKKFERGYNHSKGDSFIVGEEDGLDIISDLEDVKAFIEQELAKAREEERERVKSKADELKTISDPCCKLTLDDLLTNLRDKDE